MAVSRATKFRKLCWRESVTKTAYYLRKAKKVSKIVYPMPVVQQEDLEEFTKAPEYPVCFDTSPLGLKRIQRQVWYDSVGALPTVEEKLLAICKDKPTMVFMVSPFPNGYNTLPFTLHCTQTHLIEDSLPDHYRQWNVDPLVEYVKQSVVAAIRDVFSDVALGTQEVLDGVSSSNEETREQLRGQAMADHIFRVVASVLSAELPHLRECQVDYNPRCDSFWWSGGFPPTTSVKKHRKNTKTGTNLPVDHPMDFLFQYISKPFMQIRNEHPLPAFLSESDPLCTTNQVPMYNYDPRTAGLKYMWRYATAVPGFWPTDPAGFGTMLIHTREEALRLASKFGDGHIPSVLYNCGVLSSFAWLVAMAYYKGFSPFQELTYPMTTQTVITNGQLWSFYAYQLNTICLSEDFRTNSTQNICWATKEMKLFDAVENGEVHGFNDATLAHLVKFMVNCPQERNGINLTPYLAPVQHSAQVWDHTNMIWKSKYANRPGVGIKTETFLWEKIYKIKFNAKLE